MTRRDYTLIFLLSVIIITAAGFIQKSAGYMDAQYYAVTGREIIFRERLHAKFPVELPG